MRAGALARAPGPRQVWDGRVDPLTTASRLTWGCALASAASVPITQGSLWATRPAAMRLTLAMSFAGVIARPNDPSGAAPGRRVHEDGCDELAHLDAWGMWS